MKRRVMVLCFALIGLMGLASCGEDTTPPPGMSCTLSGTLTDTTGTMTTGSPFTITIRYNTTAVPPYAKEVSSIWPGSTAAVAYSFDISSVTAGNYWIFITTSDTNNWGWSGTTAIAIDCGTVVNLTIAALGT